MTFATLAWGGNAVAGKLAVGHVAPFTITTGRWAIACLILIPIAWPHLKRDWPIIRKNLPFLALCGGLGFAVFNNLLYLALNYISAINASIEQASMPLVVFILNYLLYRTRVTFFQLLGFAVTIIGIIITAARGDIFSLLAGDFNIGDLIMLIAIMFYGMYSVILKNKPDIHLLSFMTVLSIFALITSLPFIFYEIHADRFVYPDAVGWGIIVYAALFPSISSQLAWVMGIEQIGSNKGGLFINLVPVFGTILAIIILGEAFESYHALGFALVLGGITIAQVTSKKQKAP